MRKNIILVIACLFLAFASFGRDLSVNIKQRIDYDIARKNLIEDGWQTYPRWEKNADTIESMAEATSCGESDEFGDQMCRKYEEWDGCGHVCEMYFVDIKRNKTLRVMTNHHDASDETETKGSVIGWGFDTYQHVQQEKKEEKPKPKEKTWADVKWVKVSNNYYYSKDYLFRQQELRPGVWQDEFRIDVMSNLPDMYVVGQAESVIRSIEGSCNQKTYAVMSIIYFRGQNATGWVENHINAFPATYRRVNPNDQFAKVYSMICSRTKK